ncbi:MAG TPA: gas vesicle protein GvpK [Bacillota bacterium]|nr:gas vesicle protein GvpK [Bacillota bacterium]
MPVKIEEEKLKEGLLGLVIALVEIIAEVLKLQALKRITTGRLTEVQVDRLGQGIMDIETTVEKIKREQGLESSVADFRNNLDDLVEDVLVRFEAYD